MNPLQLLRRRRGPRANEIPPPPPIWVWKCSIHTIPNLNHAACPSFFPTAPELRRHYIRDHRLPPASVSANQHQLMIRRRLPPGQDQEQEPQRYSSVREFVRGEDFDPRWPTGPVDDTYGPWMVRGRGEVGEDLQEARERREERNPRAWERMFVPDWYYDEISRRVRMAKGRMWGGCGIEEGDNRSERRT